ncbi:MAG: hypothetical protein AABX39_03195 [Nanoarchaeota archaeon]
MMEEITGEFARSCPMMGGSSGMMGYGAGGVFGSALWLVWWLVFVALTVWVARWVWFKAGEQSKRKK